MAFERILRLAWLRLRSLFAARQVDQELTEELQDHFDHLVAAHVADGLSPDEAAARARRMMYGVERQKEACRDQRGVAFVDETIRDLRYAVRTSIKRPVSTAIAILSLALAIGANTAIFSLVNGLLLRTLPVRDPARLAMVTASERGLHGEWSYAVWSEVRRRPELFERAAAFSSISRGSTRTADGYQPIDGMFVSGSFFETLGVPAALGRMLVEADDRPGGGPDGPVAVVSDRFWRERLGGADDVVGRTLSMEQVAFTIVGVTPPSFAGPEVGRAFDVIVPLGTEPLVDRTDMRLSKTSVTWLWIVGRLRPDQTMDAATAAFRSVQRAILDATLPEGWPEKALADYRRQKVTLLPAATGNSALRERFQRPLLTVMAVVVLVLLIASANIANVLLSRVTARRHELSVRRALGASRNRLARQMFTESALIAVAGAAAGLLLTPFATTMLIRQLSSATNTVVLDVPIDLRVQAFALAVTALTTILFGTLPAISASEIEPTDALNTRETVGWGRSHAIASGGLIVAQVVLSLVLVVGAGLLVRTFASLETRPLGFDPNHVLVASINAHQAAPQTRQRIALYERSRDAIRALPGVENAVLSIATPPVTGVASILPLSAVDGVDVSAKPLVKRMGLANFVTPGWFETFGTPIVSGRDIADGDRHGAPLVAMVNQAFARKYFDDANPVGRHLTAAIAGRAIDWTIVGVGGDAVFRSLRHPFEPAIYLPLVQAADWAPPGILAQVSLTVRSRTIPPQTLARSVASAVAGVNPDLVTTFQPLAEQVNDSIAQERLVAILSGAFGSLALLLAGLGLYGVTAFAVSRRRAEIGIRMALGADAAGVVRLMVARVALLVGIGIVAGAVLSAWLSTFVATLLYGLEPRDPATFLGAAVLLAAVAAIAAWLPARAASRLDPAEVLRRV